MKTKKQSFWRNLGIGAVAFVSGLVGLVQTAVAEVKPAEIKTSGNVTYFWAGEAKSGEPTSYAEINHLTTFPCEIKVCGFLDFYKDGNGYYGKTIIEKGLTDRLNFRSHITHVNDPFSQAGFGLSYSLPTPKGTFAKIGYLPFYVDSEGRQVDDKQAACFAAGIELAKDIELSAFGEINPAAEKGPRWGYGEIELAKKLGEHLSIGANLQLNPKGAGKLTPEVIPRVSLRYLF